MQFFYKSFGTVHTFWEGHKDMIKSPNFFDSKKQFQIKFGQLLLAFSEYLNFKAGA